METWSVWGQLPKTSDQCREHLDALAKTEAKEIHRGIFGHLYQSLTFIDIKSGSLLQFVSILIAVYSIFLATVKSREAALFLIIGMLIVIASAIVLLNVVWIHWSTTDDFGNQETHLSGLLMVRNKRTVLYRSSWYGAILGVVFLVAYMLNAVLSILKLPHIESLLPPLGLQ